MIPKWYINYVGVDVTFEQLINKDGTRFIYKLAKQPVTGFPLFWSKNCQ